MRETTVHIAGRDYTIAPKTIGQNRAWRDKLSTQVEPIIDAMGDLKGTAINDFDNLTALAKTIKSTVMQSADTVLDLLCEYAPAIAADRTRIEDEGYDEEIFAAFGKVLAVVFPLGSLVKGLTGQNLNGRTAPTTSKSLSEPNTAKAPTGQMP